MAEFERLHGKKATHLNAFLTRKHYKEFKKILLEAVDSHWDEKIYDATVEEYDLPYQSPPEMTQEELEEAIQTMKNKVTEEFREGWE